MLEDAAGRLVGMEIKASSTVGRKDFSGFDALLEDMGPRFVRGVVLYSSDQAVSFADKYVALPVSALWQMMAWAVPAWEEPERRLAQLEAACARSYA